MTEMIIDEETEMNERQEAIDEAKTAESEPRKSQGRPNGPIGKPMQKAAPGTTKRIFGYIFQYKWRVAIVVLCILIGAAAQSRIRAVPAITDRQLHPADGRCEQS